MRGIDGVRPRLGIETGSGRLAYRVDGPKGAPVLVLSNSLGTSLEMWEPQMAALTSYYRVVRYDQRGHGDSPAPAGPYDLEALGRDVLALAEALDAERFHFCGLSLGGMVGMWLGTHCPDRLDRLVVACSAPYLGPPEPWLDRAATVRRDGTASIAPGLFARWFTEAFRREEAPVLEAFAAMVARADDEGYASCCEAIAAFDARPEIEKIPVPTLVLAGAEDPVVAPEMAAALAGAIPGSSLTVLAGASHLANVERPEAFSGAVLSHLGGARIERGLVARSGVLGAAHVEASMARAARSGLEAIESFQRLITEYAWGSVWARPAIDRPTRRLVTLALLAGLGRLEEFELHARAALAGDDGVDAELVGEVLLHTAVYAGVPAANAAFSVLERLARERRTA